MVRAFRDVFTYASVFVGRSRALGVLTEELRRVTGGEPRILWVVGESGIGKTALVRRGLERAPHRRVWISGEESETGLPWGVVLQARAALGLEARIAAGDGADPFEVGAELLTDLASLDEPTAVVVDDLQWADAPSAAALLFALRRVQVEPVLFVLITRPEPGQSLGDSWQRLLADPHRGSTIALDGLDVDDIIELSAAVGTGRLDPDAAQRLHEHTRGHPLHTLVLLEELGADDLRDVGGVLPAPRTLAALTLAKVASLAPPTQQLVEAGAVLGTAFALPIGATVAAITEPLPALEEAMDAGLLERTPSQLVAFTHPLLRGAVYNDLSATRQAELHRAASEATSGRVALHHRARAAGGPDEMLAAEFEKLAEEELAAGRVSSAAEQLRIAATLSPEPEDRDRRVLRAAEALLIGNYPARAKSMRSVVEACAETPYRNLILGIIEFHDGRWSAAKSQLTTAIANDPHSTVAARAQVGLALTYSLEGRWDDALQAVEASHAGDVGWGAGIARYVQAMGLMQLDRADELSTQLRSLDAEGAAANVATLDVLAARGLMKFLNEDIAGAVDDMSTVVQRGRGGEPARFFTATLSFLSEAEYRLGRWDDALVHAELVVSLAESSEELMALLHGLAAAARVYAGRGRFEQAQANIDALQEIAQLIPSWNGQFQAATARALLAQAQGDRDAMYRAAVGLLDESVRPNLVSLRTWRWRALIVEGYLGVNKLEDARAALADLVALVDAHDFDAARPDVARLEGQLAEASGNVESARRHYAAVTDQPDESTVVPLSEPRLRLARGHFLHAQGETRAAIAELRAARASLARLGAVPFIGACDAELEACGLRAAKGSDRDLLALTPREEAVARLVASGLSNREAAAELYVSTKAVEYHLGHIYAKLGITSRRQLAGRLRAEPPGN
jgi:DNA-binding CsgD family transcriptional regulator